MTFEIYYEADFELRVTLFDIEIYNCFEDKMTVTKIESQPHLENLLTYFLKRCDDKGFDKESFTKDTGYINRLYSEMFLLFEHKTPFYQILDELERIINRYAEKWGLNVSRLTILMKEEIHQTILAILEQKRRDGDVLPFATSIEVAHLLHMNAVEVEKIAEGIEGIVRGRTLNYEWYHE